MRDPIPPFPLPLRRGEDEAVPRVSDLGSLQASTAGKLELEYAGADRSEAEITRDLIRRATKVVFDERIPLEGDVPSPIDPPKGCRFHTRCPYVVEACRRDEPPLSEVQPGHFVACHLREAGAPPVKLEKQASPGA